MYTSRHYDKVTVYQHDKKEEETTLHAQTLNYIDPKMTGHLVDICLWVHTSYTIIELKSNVLPYMVKTSAT